MTRKQRGRKNRGWFRKGKDPRRHRLSPSECRRGGQQSFRRLMEDKPWFLLWLKKRIRRFYAAKETPA